MFWRVSLDYAFSNITFRAVCNIADYKHESSVKFQRSKCTSKKV